MIENGGIAKRKLNGQLGELGLDDVPVGQLGHDAEPELEYVRAPQIAQVAVEVAPIAVEKVPALQFVQTGAPDADHVPTPHVAHVELCDAPVADE